MTYTKIILEVCANSVPSAVAAQDGGAFRVELCENLDIGGTTPSIGDILAARKLLRIKLNVLIHPRGGNFFYSDAEFELMKTNTKQCIDAGCNGVVFGILKADGTFDNERCLELLNMAKQEGLSATFHRAFDECKDMSKALEDIIAMGFDRILTSGGENTALEGAAVIAKLIIQAAGRIVIMPGAGINQTNVREIVLITKATEVHSSARAGKNATDDKEVKAIITNANY